MTRTDIARAIYGALTLTIAILGGAAFIGLAILTSRDIDNPLPLLALIVGTILGTAVLAITGLGGRRPTIPNPYAAPGPRHTDSTNPTGPKPRSPEAIAATTGHLNRNESPAKVFPSA